MIENIKPGVFNNRREKDRREEDRREEPLRACPLCQNEVIDLGYGISCPECNLLLTDNEKTQSYGGYKHLWQHRDGMKVLKDFI